LAGAGVWVEGIHAAKSPFCPMEIYGQIRLLAVFPRLMSVAWARIGGTVQALAPMSIRPEISLSGQDPVIADRLARILEHKRKEIEPLIPRTRALKEEALRRNDFRSLRQALEEGPQGLSLIAEVKKASPSVGVISEEFEPVDIALGYEYAGAQAISVLTDEKFFQGRLEYMSEVRRAVRIPVLRKDFIVHECQIYEACCAGADAILLIVAALDQPTLQRLLAVAYGCQMDVLVEVHNLDELERALDTDVEILGINNRNLHTFQVDLSTTEILAEEVPDGVLLVSESGIFTAQDSKRVFEAGANSILVGEALMRSSDVNQHVVDLLSVGGVPYNRGEYDENDMG
jgi:indole-3-glycerol phosphate synthase